MTTMLPVDDANRPIPVARLRQNGAHSIAATTTDHYFPAGVYYDIAISGGTVAQYRYLSVRAVGADCTVYLSEKE